VLVKIKVNKQGWELTLAYSSGQLIPIFCTVAVAELGIKGPLEYLQV